MKQLLSIILFFSLISSTSLCAEETLSKIRTLTAQVKEPSGAVEGTILEEIAVTTYESLLNAPLVGLESTQSEIEALIALRKSLETHTGVSEQLLAIRIQEAVDRMLLVEVRRRAAYMKGRHLSFPYKVDSLTPDIAHALLKENAIAERETLQYAQSLNGQFAKFCKSKNFNVDDFLSGEAARSLAPDMKVFIQRFQDMRISILIGKDRQNIEDILFVYLLTAIDHARDVRIVCEIYLEGLPDSLKIFHERIEQQLESSPHIRLSSGLYSLPRDVATVVSKNRSKDYPVTLTNMFLSYFSNPKATAAKFDEIFFQYSGEQRGFSSLLGL